MNSAERAEAVIQALGQAVVCDNCGLVYHEPWDCYGFMCLCGDMLYVHPRRPSLNVYRPDLLWD